MESYSIDSTDHFINQQKTHCDIRANNELFDVTLACKDLTIRSHKLLLASSSRFFREVFKQMDQPNPFIFLNGLQADDLQAIIDFIYTGKTKVEANNIRRFLKFATELKVYGIIKDEEVEESTKDEVKEKLKKKIDKSKKQKSVKSTEVKTEFNGSKEDTNMNNESNSDFEPDTSENEHLSSSGDLELHDHELKIHIGGSDGGDENLFPHSRIRGKRRRCTTCTKNILGVGYENARKKLAPVSLQCQRCKDSVCKDHYFVVCHTCTASLTTRGNIVDDNDDVNDDDFNSN